MQPPPASAGARAARLLPGIALCAAVSLAALAVEWTEAALFGRAWFGALVLAILIGTAIRTAWTPPARWQAGIAFSARTLLEIAVALLGASLGAEALAALGPALLLGIAGLVAVALASSYGIGRLLGLPRRLALLVACGNAICGNSAIVAVAPVIGARGQEIASSIAFTAVLGVLLVLGLPPAASALGMSEAQFGVLAGLTVYAVPQVLAATASGGAVAIHLGTLVKLVRVLMLGPVVVGLSVLARGRRGEADAAKLHRLVPWFVLAFLALAVLRGVGLLPQAVLAPAATAAGMLTLISMAALGLGVDLRAVTRAGGRVTAAVLASMLTLGLASLALIHLLGIA
ncbi:putative sulfate exporter family transporter [Roseomonas eburnea]|uniref:Sulfate exporter family transporter n=1 Tax=Neoroseomonas eburnea TaxID=1346889 RepID=A0A9X9XDC4_9PROT|nr:putative sulfate exporter family transporter [Neoroseomonas eburnea]MBR0681710.1 putative sulfate exporter family transporter [Neoroseomonas eburnea]